MQAGTASPIRNPVSLLNSCMYERILAEAWVNAVASTPVLWVALGARKRRAVRVWLT
jgi:hypothetical protein